MNPLWTGLGFAVLAVTLIDVFLSALNYDEAGFVAARVARVQWALTRRITRRLSRRWRPVVLRQVIGLQVMGAVITWVGGILLGYGLIYLGSMQGKNFTYEGVRGDFFGAIYFSTAQLSTVGTSAVTPNNDFVRMLAVVETLTGVVLISLILTFLLGVYDVVSNLRSLSSQFYSAGSGVGDPISSLTPYFPGGTETGLDSHLQSVSDSFSSYTDGVRLHHAAYHFQSGRDTFSLPYSLEMLGGIIGALRWGLPASHPVTTQPTLAPLTKQFDEFETYMHPLLKWTSEGVPETVTAGEFARQVRSELTTKRTRSRRQAQRTGEGDRWVHWFVLVNRDMAHLVGIEPFEDIDEAFARYVAWLPFAYSAQQFSTAVNRDLDYQPILTSPREQAPEAVLAPAPDEDARDNRAGGLKGFLSRRLTLIDPGFTRLVSAIRGLLAAALAVTVLAVGLPAIGIPPLPAAIFGGMIALFTSSAGSGGGHGIRRLGSLIAVVPVLISLGINFLVPREPVPATIALAALAFVAVALTRFGPKVGGLGQLAFMTYYFTLILRLQGGEFMLFAGVALVGVLSSVLLQMVPNKGAHVRVVKGGVLALENRLVHALDPIIDAVSAARWDPDLMRRTRSELRQTHQTASFLAGQLKGDDPDIGLTEEQADALRLRVHEAELAVVNLSSEARLATGAGIPINVRARLAGALQSVQERISDYPDAPAWVSPGTGTDDGGQDPKTNDEPDADDRQSLPSMQSAAQWPRAARGVLAAAYELQHAVDVLHSARAVDLVSTPAWVAVAPDSTPTGETDLAAASDDESATRWASAAAQPPVTADTAPIWRRAIQASVSTAIALFLGSFVSTTHQYWAAMPAYQAIGGSDGETFMKGTQRIIGTVFGAIVGFGIAITAGSNPAVLLPVLAVCVFAMTYFRGASSPLTAFWMTMMVAQLYEFMGRLNTETIGVRILETIIGAGIALIVAALVLPTRTRDKFARQAVQLTKTVESATVATLDLWKRNRQPTPDDIAALAKQEVVMTRQLRDLQATAGPLRHGSGAFEPGGIENRLTGFWELLYYTRHFIASAEQRHRAKARLTEAQWEQLETATEQNFDALIDAYEGRASGPVNPDIGADDLGDSDEPRTAEAALRALARANQTVAIMAVDLAPQAANIPLRGAEN